MHHFGELRGSFSPHLEAQQAFNPPYGHHPRGEVPLYVPKTVHVRALPQGYEALDRGQLAQSA